MIIYHIENIAKWELHHKSYFFASNTPNLFSKHAKLSISKSNNFMMDTYMKNEIYVVNFKRF